MAVKFSQFVAVSTISSSGYIVGYDGTDNVRIKTSTADTMLSFTGGSMQFSKLTNAMVSTNTIGLNKLVNLTGLSVLGNATNASAAMTAITAANDYEVLMRSGTSLVFSTIGTNNLSNSAVTYAKIQDMTPQYLLGRNSSPAGPPEEVNLSQVLEWASSVANTILARGASAWGVLTAGTNGHVLRLSGGVLGFGAITYESFYFGATQRVLGRNTAGAGAGEELTVAQLLEWLSSTANTIAYRNGSAWTTLTAGTNGHVLRLTGGALGFGTIGVDSISNSAITYAKIQDVSATLRLLGRVSAGAGVVEEVVIDTDLSSVSANDDTIPSAKAAKDYSDTKVAKSSVPVAIQVACSDLTTAITAGTNKAYFRSPFAFTLTEVRASLLTAQSTGSIFTVDINESGSSVLSTKLTIDNTEKTSTTAATPPVISDSAIADDAEITIDVDQAGTGPVGLIVTLIGTRSV